MPDNSKGEITIATGVCELACRRSQLAIHDGGTLVLRVDNVTGAAGANGGKHQAGLEGRSDLEPYNFRTMRITSS